MVLIAWKGEKFLMLEPASMIMFYTTHNGILNTELTKIKKLKDKLQINIKDFVFKLFIKSIQNSSSLKYEVF